MQEICNELKSLNVVIECDKNRVYLFLNTLSTISRADTLAQIKGMTLKRLREEFLDCVRLPSLWTHSYFVSTAGNISGETCVTNHTS